MKRPETARRYWQDAVLRIQQDSSAGAPMLQYRQYLFSFVFAGDLSGSLRLALPCRTLSISGQSLRSDPVLLTSDDHCVAANFGVARERCVTSRSAMSSNSEKEMVMLLRFFACSREHFHELTSMAHTIDRELSRRSDSRSFYRRQRCSFD